VPGDPPPARAFRLLLLSQATTTGGVITKDSCTYTIRFLRQERILRDHEKETARTPALLAVISAGRGPG
jgi:hypothetical protein